MEIKNFSTTTTTRQHAMEIAVDWRPSSSRSEITWKFSKAWLFSHCRRKFNENLVKLISEITQSCCKSLPRRPCFRKDFKSPRFSDSIDRFPFIIRDFASTTKWTWMNSFFSLLFHFPLFFTLFACLLVVCSKSAVPLRRWIDKVYSLEIATERSFIKIA